MIIKWLSLDRLLVITKCKVVTTLFIIGYKTKPLLVIPKYKVVTTSEDELIYTNIYIIKTQPN